MQSQKTAGFGTIGVLIGALVIIIAGGALLASNLETDPTLTAVVENNETLPEPTDEEIVSNEPTTSETPVVAALGTTDEVSPVAEDMPLAAGIYTEYDESLLQNASNGTVLLFFHATWCPSCRALESDITAQLENIPSDVTILKLDYDTETALKKKYGIVRQHTLIEVDAEGNLLRTLTGLSNTLDQVTKQI